MRTRVHAYTNTNTFTPYLYVYNQVPDGAQCTAYRCGDLIDLCRGPHVPDTGRYAYMHMIFFAMHVHVHTYLSISMREHKNKNQL